jgi:hypothetical protein
MTKLHGKLKACRVILRGSQEMNMFQHKAVEECDYNIM